MLDLILELANMILKHRVGLRNANWINELISELYEEYAREEAERMWNDAN